MGRAIAKPILQIIRATYLKDKQGFCGFVIQMSFNGEWEYKLTELTTEFPPLFVVRPERELVTVELSRVEAPFLRT